VPLERAGLFVFARFSLYTNGNSADNAGLEVQFGNSWKLNSIYFTNCRIGDAHHTMRQRWRGVADGAAPQSAAPVGWDRC
jgi:hypothetical protein